MIKYLKQNILNKYKPRLIVQVIDMQRESEMNFKEIGARIKKLRMRSGITQIELAKAIDVSQTHMSNIENGNTGISLYTAVKISRKLGCSIESFADKEKYDREQENISNLGNFIDIDELVAVLKLISRENKKSILPEK